jgi:hypothetical protein
MYTSDMRTDSALSALQSSKLISGTFQQVVFYDVLQTMYNHNAAAFAALMDRRTSHSASAPKGYPHHAPGIAPPPPPLRHPGQRPPSMMAQGQHPTTAEAPGRGSFNYGGMEQSQSGISWLASNIVYPAHDSNWSREKYHRPLQDRSHVYTNQHESMRGGQSLGVYMDPYFPGGYGAGSMMHRGRVDQPQHPLDRSYAPTRSYADIEESLPRNGHMPQRMYHEGQDWRPDPHGQQYGGHNMYHQHLDGNSCSEVYFSHVQRSSLADSFDDPRRPRRVPRGDPSEFANVHASYSGNYLPASRLSKPQSGSNIQCLTDASVQRAIPILPPPPPPPKDKQSEEFYCDACEKSFEQKSAFDSHIATHERCSHPGCSFEGSKKVVAAHYHGTHGLYSGTGYKTIDVEGQKFKVLMGTNEKEVEEWRAERRKRFPTANKAQLCGEVDALISSAGGVPQSRARKASSSSSSGAANQSNTLDGGETKERKSRVCFLFLRSRCTKGADCEYLHEKGAPRPSCKNFSIGRCKYGDKCMYLHESGGAALGPDKEADPTAESSCRESASSRKRDSSCLAAPNKTNKKCQLQLPVPLGASGSTSSLLRRLLQRQGLEEENLLLQALHFIAETMLQAIAPVDV